MEVDAVEPETGAGKKEYTEEEWTNYIDTLTAQIEEINYMGAGKGWKGGKGKGRDGGKGKGGKGKDEKGKGKGGKGKETRTCYHCQKPGHLIEQCRAKKAGKPKVKPGDVNVGVLGEEELEEDEECGCIDIPCCYCACESGTEEPDMATEEDIEALMTEESADREEFAKERQETAMEDKIAKFKVFMEMQEIIYSEFQKTAGKDEIQKIKKSRKPSSAPR